MGLDIQIVESAVSALKELSSLSFFKSKTFDIYAVSYKNENDHLETLVNELNAKEEAGEKVGGLSKLRLKLREPFDISSFQTTINKSIVIYSCSIFDSFINDLLYAFYSKYEKSLSSSKRNITYEQIFSFSNLAELKKEIIQKEIFELSYKNIEERITFLSEKLNLDLILGNTDSEIFSGSINSYKLKEIFAIRNVIVHNKGVADNIFLTITKNPIYRLNQEIEVSNEIADNCVTLFVKTIFEIQHQAEKRYWS